MAPYKLIFEETVLELEEEFHRKFPDKPETSDEQSLSDRIRRSLSWLERAALAPGTDKPPRFVDLWIGLNALYGVRTYERGSPSQDRRDFQNFLRKLRRLDSGNQLLVSLMKRERIVSLVLGIIVNKYLWYEFWRREPEVLERMVRAEQKAVELALRENDVVTFYTCLFRRLHVLRNQIFHGSSSATTRRSRDALTPAIRLLQEILPTFLRVMITGGSGKDWPRVPYPGIDTVQHPH
jgi:hypothetical protein